MTTLSDRLDALAASARSELDQVRAMLMRARGTVMERTEGSFVIVYFPAPSVDEWRAERFGPPARPAGDKEGV